MSNSVNSLPMGYIAVSLGVVTGIGTIIASVATSCFPGLVLGTIVATGSVVSGFYHFLNQGDKQKQIQHSFDRNANDLRDSDSQYL